MFGRDCNKVIYLTWTQTSLCRYLENLPLLLFFPLVREDLNLQPTRIWHAHRRRSKFIPNVIVDMKTCYSLISNLKFGHSQATEQFPISEYTAILRALRWVVSGARKSFPGHLHWFFTWDQLGDRQISDVHVGKILLCLLHKTNVIYVTVGLFINRSPEDVIKQLEHQWHTRLRLMCRFFCSYNIMTSSVIYYGTDPRKNGRCVTPRNMTAREILKMDRSI